MLAALNAYGVKGGGGGGVYETFEPKETPRSERFEPKPGTPVASETDKAKADAVLRKRNLAA